MKQTIGVRRTNNNGNRYYRAMQQQEKTFSNIMGKSYTDKIEVSQVKTKYGETLNVWTVR